MRRTAALLLAATLLLAACADSGDDEAASAASGEPDDSAAPTSEPDSDETPSTTGSSVSMNEPDTEATPAVTPVDDATLEAAFEEGEVLLYTNAEDQQMAPIREAFEAAHPDITLRSLPLGDEEMFQRYQTETASGTRTADLVMNNNSLAWLWFIDGGHIAPYEDPNTPNLPEYAVLADGVYAASLEPVIAVFNTALLPESEQPTTIAELAAAAEQLDGMIGTTDISNAIQFGATTAFTDTYGDAGWETLERLGAHASVESSNGPLVTKLAQGQYIASFFVAGSVRAFIVDDVARVVNYAYLDDGTPLLPRAVGVTAEAPHPNAARVFLNWLLSVEGQEAACAGGFTPYRDGVDCEFGLPSILAEVGEENLIIGSFDADLVGRSTEIIDRWNEAFGR